MLLDHFEMLLYYNINLKSLNINNSLEMAIKFDYSYKFGIKNFQKTLVFKKKMLDHDQLELGIKK